ncbi:hypothetical protein OTERR_15230 [Oryzomicrobium terrae]|uniref:Uncharacterized protein n=1 Tax=Oryzomicrobium terrae TaxID=1735038 RepID=A0A5C1E8Q2_9RHOO|nr:DUF1318 domain-containing protein [Oryzomicrobium terrae]QEL64999.1 hypothetical protein OTERR_15230 [Oryzomicrobium terrae]
MTSLPLMGWIRRAPWRALGVLLGLVVLSACTSVGLYTGAAGTQEEARAVVRVVYGQGGDSEVDRLPYEGGDLSRVVRCLRDRYPRLQAWYVQGVIGNTLGGFVAIRDDDRRQEVRDLVRQENRDRAQLYTHSSGEVGHGTDDLQSWLPYEQESFGAEWVKQSPSGWWYMDRARLWHKKQTPADVPPVRESQPINSRFVW